MRCASSWISTSSPSRAPTSTSGFSSCSAFFLGVFTTSLYGIYELYQQRQTIRQLRHNLEILAKELKQAGATAQASAAAPEPQIAPRSE